MFGKTRLFMVYSFILMLSGTVVLAAEDDNGSDNGSQEEQQAEQQQELAISRRQASDIVRERYQGRILNIRLEGARWAVRMDNEGTVFNVFVDARTGAVTGPTQ